ncbi:MAG: hypothetical protein JTJ21_05220 [Holdemanella sp.]|nr:hypothetical protein [Holdemanella sp.]
MISIDKKEVMDIFTMASEISQTLESKQYLSLYEDKEKYNVLITKLIANTVFKLNCTHN